MCLTFLCGVVWGCVPYLPLGGGWWVYLTFLCGMVGGVCLTFLCGGVGRCSASSFVVAVGAILSCSTEQL